MRSLFLLFTDILLDLIIVQSHYLVCQKPKATRPQAFTWQPTVPGNDPRSETLQTKTKTQNSGNIYYKKINFKKKKKLNFKQLAFLPQETC